MPRGILLAITRAASTSKNNAQDVERGDWWKERDHMECFGDAPIIIASVVHIQKEFINLILRLGMKAGTLFLIGELMELDLKKQPWFRVVFSFFGSVFFLLLFTL
jgi:hypothetical protein